MTQPAPPICSFCVHAQLRQSRCDAFPSGIPKAVIENRADHRQPIEGDHGIQFRQDPAKPELPKFVTEILGAR